MLGLTEVKAGVKASPAPPGSHLIWPPGSTGPTFQAGLITSCLGRVEPRWLNKESRCHNMVIKRLLLLDLVAPWPREIEVLLGMPEDYEAAELSSALPSPTIQSHPFRLFPGSVS